MVRGVRDICVTVFTFGVHVEIQVIILPEDISYGPRAMSDIIHYFFYLLLLRVMTSCYTSC